MKVGSLYKILSPRHYATKVVDKEKKTLSSILIKGSQNHILTGTIPKPCYIDKNEIFLLLEYDNKTVYREGYDVIEHNLIVLYGATKYNLKLSVMTGIGHSVESCFGLVC